MAPELAAAFALASEFECTEFELLSVFVEVDGAEGVAGGVQVGQLEPPLLQVADAAAPARASAAAMRRCVGFTVQSFVVVVGGFAQGVALLSTAPAFRLAAAAAISWPHSFTSSSPRFQSEPKTRSSCAR